MCGIAGRWSTRPPGFSLDAALERLEHRGPDDRGTWRSDGGELEFAHTRLAIIDLSPAGHQPMTSNDGRVVLVYNGELYNHRELAAELRARGHTFRGHSDTEVLLALYAELGASMLSRLNGMFAFAAYDRDARELTLARDAFGIKPLYYCESEAGFAFASELKALTRLAPVAPQLDVVALYRYLSFLWCPGTATPLASVKRLAPGELLRVRDGRVLERRSWARAPAVHASHPARLEPSPATVAAALRRAVQRQLVADVPVGAFLSGGLDSSAVATFAHEQQPGIDCFTIVPDGGPEPGEVSDVPYARRVARRLGVRLHEVQISSARMAADLEQMVYRLDEPIADPAPLNVLYISRLARQHGIKVLLSGVGGDDLFAGYRRHHALISESAWSWLPQPVRRGLRQGSAGLARLGQHAPGAAALQLLTRRAARAFAHADRGGDERLIGYFSWAEPGTLRELFHTDHRSQLTPAAQTEPLLQFLHTLPAGLSRLEQMLALEQRFFLGDHNLPYADKMSMAAGVEVRVPFLDPDLVELANRIAPELKQRGRHGKWILKRAMAPYLPADVIERDKVGFGAPWRRWLRGELADWVRDVLSPERLRRRGLFDDRAVLALLDRDRRGDVDAAYPILGLCCVELWCRHFLDGDLAPEARS